MKQVLFYRLFFKHRDETPLKISIEGYEKLLPIITGTNPPLFIKIKGRVIARSEISQIVPVTKESYVE